MAVPNVPIILHVQRWTEATADSQQSFTMLQQVGAVYVFLFQ